MKIWAARRYGRQNRRWHILATVGLFLFVNVLPLVDSLPIGQVPHANALLQNDRVSQTEALIQTGQVPQGYTLLPTENDGRGLGDTSGSFSVSDDGAANYKVPLWVPPGRAGIQPLLTLAYASRADNGLLGVGWKLAGRSEIIRCRRTLAQDGIARTIEFAPTDAFCLDGRRLVLVGPTAGGGGEFRLEQDPATRILMYNDSQGPLYFEVYHQDGYISVYGTPTSANGDNTRLEGQRVKVATASNSTDAVIESQTVVRYAWAIWELRDRSGNYLRWTYNLNTAVGPTGATHYEQLPVEIQYTGFSGTSPSGVGVTPNRKVSFTYETRPDTNFDFISGFGLKSTLRLKEIVMSGPSISDPAYAGSQYNGPLRRYKLQYDTPSITKRSLLHSIDECDGNDICRVPIKFRWELGCGFGTPTAPDRVGTGCSKYFDADANEFEDLDLGYGDVMQYSTDATAWLNLPEVADFWTLQTADIDGDGRDDLLYRVPQLNHSRTMLVKVDWYYRLSTGRGFGPAVKALLPESKTGATIEDLRTVDINGDGKAEVVSVINADPVMGKNGSYEIYTLDGSQFKPAGIASSESFQGWWKASEPTLFPIMHVADLNGDGRPELARSAVLVDPNNPTKNPLPYRWGFRNNNSSGSFQLSSYSALGVTSGIDHAGYTVDWNNDGTVDLLVRDAVPLGAGDGFSSQLYAVSVNTQGQVIKTPTALSGLPFELSSQLSPLAAPSWPSYTYFRTWFADINGDGLPDAVAVREHQKVEFPSIGQLSVLDGDPYIAINTGNGFKPYQRKAITASIGEISPMYDPQSQRNVDVGVRTLDYNSDGKLDLLVADSGSRLGGGNRRRRLVVLQSNGNGFDVQPLKIPVGDTTILGVQGGSYAHGYGQRMVQVLDANGDGMTDIVQVVAGRLHLYLRKGKRPDVILGIDRRTQTPGISITYEPIASNPNVYVSGTCTYPQQCVNHGLWIVSRHSVENGQGGLNSWRYTYADGRLDLKGRGWLGFGRMTVTDEQTNASTITTKDNITTVKPNANAATYLYPFAGTVSSQIFTVKVDQLSSSPTYRRTLQVTHKTKFDNSGKVVFAYPETTAFKEEEGLNSPLQVFRTKSVSLLEDGYGNVIQSSQTMDTIPGQVGSPAHKQELGVAYKNDSSAWLIGRPETINITSTVPLGRTASRSWRYRYSEVTGLLEQVEVAPNHLFDPVRPNSSDLYLETYYVRDAYGLVTSVQESGSTSFREQTIEYDKLDNTFPRTLTNAAGHVEHLYYHSGLGAIAVEDDPNGLRTTYSYDGYGRVRGIDFPDAADVSIRYTSGYSAGDIPGQAIIRQVTQSDLKWNNPVEEVTFDPLGRPARYERTAFGGGRSIVDVAYDRFGRVSNVSEPYLSSSKNPYPRIGYTNYGYDQLGRLRGITRPNALARLFQYEGLTMKELDEEGNLHYTVQDVLGRLVRSVDVEPGGRELRTMLEYGPFDTLETVIDAYGNRTSMEYDEIGRRIKLTDPDTGDEQTYFDGFGDPKLVIDGNGQATTYRYDALRRIYTMTNAAGTTIYKWDSSANGIGKLDQTETPDGIRTAYNYDAYGRLVGEAWSIQGQFFSILRDYDKYGRLEQLTYPSAVGKPDAGVHYIYNERGFLQEIRQPGYNGNLYWKANTRNAAGAVTSETFGNGLTTQRSYDIENRLKFVETLKPPAQGGTGQPTPVQVLAYDYDFRRGLLQSRHDLLAKTTEDFEYDFLERLTKWTVYQDCRRSVLTYGYDDIGNLLNRTVVEGLGANVVNSYAGPSGGPHAIKISTTAGQVASYSYDTAGRQKAGPSRTVEYTPFDLPSRIDSSQLRIDFKYDALHRRVSKKKSNGDETIYVGDFYERRKTSAGISHIFNIYGPDRQVAQLVWTEVNGAIAGREIYYLHDDRLGSTDTVTSGSGTVVERLKYEPFGSRRDPANIASPAVPPQGVAQQGFTGHKPDDDLALVNMKGRIYDPVSGRFLTADPFISKPQSGQSYNRYSYVRNSPLTYVDPMGFEEGTVEQGYDSKSSFSFDIYDLVLRIAHAFSEEGDHASTQLSESAPATMTGHADKQGSQAGGFGEESTNLSDTNMMPGDNRPSDVNADLGNPSAANYAQPPEGDIFVWVSAERELASFEETRLKGTILKGSKFGLGAAGESIGIAGWNPNQGFYTAGIIAGGVEATIGKGRNGVYGAAYYGREYMSGHPEENILLVEGGITSRITGILAGAYELSDPRTGKKGELGVYFGGKLGPFAAGIGFDPVAPLKAIYRVLMGPFYPEFDPNTHPLEGVWFYPDRTLFW